MSAAFGVDLLDVLIHEGGVAKALGADAFTRHRYPLPPLDATTRQASVGSRSSVTS